LNAVATDPDSKNVVMIAAFTGLDQWAHAIGDKCNKAGTATPLPLPFATDPCHCDYALVVDTSLSIGNNYPLVKQFLTQFVNNLQTYLDGDNDTRVAIVGFASTAYVATPLTGTYATLMTGISKLPQLASGTNTASGILAGQGQLTANSRGLGTCKRMIIVTDGASTPAVTGPAKATAQAHIAKSQYQIQVSVVGVGVPASAAAELNSLASAPLSINGITLTNFASLPNVAATMVGQCAKNATPNAFQQDCQCDIMLVFDGSGSVPATAWQQTEDFCVQLITGWAGAMQAGKSRIGIVTFGTTPKLVSGLTNDVTSLVNLCSTMSQNGGGTNTADALTMAGNELMNKGGNCRGIKLLTDGNSNNPKQTDLVAEKLKLQGRIVIMAIGIGKGINMNELRDVATAPTTVNAINIADFTGLGTVGSSITGKCGSAIYNQQTQCQYTNMMKCTLTTSKDRCALPVAYNSCAATYKCPDVLKYLCATQFMTNTMYKTCPTVPSMCTAATTASGCDTSAFQTCQNNANKYASTTCARLNRYVACAFATACQDMSQAYCQGSDQGCTLTGCTYLTPIIASPPPVLSPRVMIAPPLVSQIMPVASPFVAINSGVVNPMVKSAAEQAAIDESLSMFLPAGTKWNASARSSGSSVASLGGLAVLIAALAGALVALVIKYRRSAASADEEELEEHLVA
jgi:Mg-chelatase subunit ChlD